MTRYSDKIAGVICSRIADGESLRTICADPEMPTMANVFRWIPKHPEFAEQYRTAREMQADAGFEDMLAIESLVLSGNCEPQRARVVLDSMKWRLSKMIPKKYGDAAALRLSGPDDGPIKTQPGNNHNFDMNIEAIRKAMEEA